MPYHPVQTLAAVCTIVVLLCPLRALSGSSQSPAGQKDHPGGQMVLVGTEGVKNSVYGEFLTLVFTEAFERLGYGFQYRGYPAARASAISDAGNADGEISRVFEYQAAHPNLIRIEEPLYSTSFAAYAARPGLVVHGWESLAGKKIHVEYRRGVKLSQSKLSNVVDKDYLSYVASVEQGLKKLLAGRTDLYVDVEFTIREAIKQLESERFEVSALYPAGTLQKVDAFAYLHKKHARLVPELTTCLQAMKKEGLFKRYLEKALGQPSPPSGREGRSITVPEAYPSPYTAR